MDSSMTPPAAKRPRHNDLPVGAATPVATTAEESSVADILSVPLEIIFHQHRNKPVLSRAEAQTFLSVTMLAGEMDCLVAACADQLARKIHHKSLAQRIQHQPYLRPLVALLRSNHDEFLGCRIPNELDRIVAELQNAAHLLRQFSEQNWLLAESLLEGIADLAEWKKRLSDIQEELANRVDGLLKAETEETSVGTMKNYCTGVWKDVAEKPQLPLAQLTSPPAVQQTSDSTSDIRVETPAASVSSPANFVSTAPPQSNSSKPSPMMETPASVPGDYVSTALPVQQSLPSGNKMTDTPRSVPAAAASIDKTRPGEDNPPSSFQTAEHQQTTSPEATTRTTTTITAFNTGNHQEPSSEENLMSATKSPLAKSLQEETAHTTASQKKNPEESQAASSSSTPLAAESPSFTRELLAPLPTAAMAEASCTQKSVTREKENVSSQSSEQRSSSQQQQQQQQGLALVYGSQESLVGATDSQLSCRLSSSAVSAAELLSSFANTSAGHGVASPK